MYDFGHCVGRCTIIIFSEVYEYFNDGFYSFNLKRINTNEDQSIPQGEKRIKK